MGRIVVVAGPLYVDFTTAVTYPAASEYHPVLLPQDKRHWARELGGSAWKVAAYWKKHHQTDEVILVSRIAKPWSNDTFQEHRSRPFVDDARWLTVKLDDENRHSGALAGVTIDRVISEKGVDYTFHLQREQVEWPIQTIAGGAAQELSSKDLRAVFARRVEPLLASRPRTEVLVLLCGIARTQIFEDLVKDPLALDSLLPDRPRPRIVIDFGRVDFREREGGKKGKNEGKKGLENLRKFVHESNLAFLDEPTATALDLLAPEYVPQQGLIVRHTLSGTWWAYRNRIAPGAADTRQSLERQRVKSPPEALSRPQRFAELVAKWNWSRCAPASAGQNDWHEYQRLNSYRHPEDITADQALLAQLKVIEASVTTRKITKLLIYGETGTGKEIIARWLHRVLWKRKGYGEIKEVPYVVISPGGSNEIAQSKLFGHVKGSFTTAIEDTNGAFQRAQTGLLLLDDLQKISLTVQELMLRVLEYGEIEKVGSQETNSLSEGDSELDLFLVCTVNERPDELIRGDKLLKDLFYRFTRDGYYLQLSPLRERKDDALRAARKVWHDLASRHGEVAAEFPPALEQAIRRGRLEGNFRTIDSIVRQQDNIDQLKKEGHPTESLERYLQEMIDADSTAAVLAPDQPSANKQPEPNRLEHSDCHAWIVENRATLETRWQAESGHRTLDSLSTKLDFILWACVRYRDDNGGFVKLKKQHFLDLLGPRVKPAHWRGAMETPPRNAEWQLVDSGKTKGAYYTLPSSPQNET